MDEASLEIMVAALAGPLPGTFITKIHQMTPYHLLLRLRGGGRSGQLRLLIAIAPREPGLHLTSRRYLNPPRPLRFCAYLRHHLQGARISAIEKITGDRIVIIRAARRHEEEQQLVIELLGKRGNALLCQGAEMRIGALMHDKNQAERLKPGTIYQPPPARPAEPGAPVSAKILLETIGINDCHTVSAQDLQTAYDDWFFPLYQAHYGNIETRHAIKSLQQYQRRLRKRVKKLRQEQSEKLKHLDDNRIGDLLKGEIHKIKRGAAKATVIDYYSPNLDKIEISLNPALSPVKNLEKFYKNAKKAKRGLKLIEERLQATEAEADYAAELIFQLEQLSNDPSRAISDEEQELLELTAELSGKKHRVTPAGPQRGGSGKTGEKAKTRATPGKEKILARKQRGVEKISGVSGGIIYLGKNVIGNENIYRHLGAPDDLWFHAHECPGAHVLLKTAPGAKEYEKEQLQAAALAAKNSKLQSEKAIAVTMTRVKYLHKPKGGRLGQLLLSGPTRTIMVNNYD